MQDYGRRADDTIQGDERLTLALVGGTSNQVFFPSWTERFLKNTGMTS
jgi:hypothetical protein